MDLTDNPNVIGAVTGLWQGQHERLNELDARLAERHFPDRPLQPNFNFRPVPTKYAYMPIIDRRARPQEPIAHYPQHDIATNLRRTPDAKREEFEYSPETPYKGVLGGISPATSNGPVGTYLANIDLETVLQNRHVALQHGADQGVYVPHSSSDLYGFSAVGRQEDMGERAMIFDKYGLATKGSEVASMVGNDRFHNNTRTQLRGL